MQLARERVRQCQNISFQPKPQPLEIPVDFCQALALVSRKGACCSQHYGVIYYVASAGLQLTHQPRSDASFQMERLHQDPGNKPS